MKAFETVPLSRLLALRKPDTMVQPDAQYEFAGVKSFGKGVFRAAVKSGASFSYRTLTRIHEGEFVYPKLMAWEGGLGVVTPDCDGLYVSPEFCVFEIDRSQVLPRWIDVFFRRPSVWPKLAGGSGGTNMRRRRIYPADFLKFEMPLPPLSEQQSIVARVDALAAKTSELDARLVAADRAAEHLLAIRFRDATSDAPMRPMAEVAPLVRREVGIDPDTNYTELGVRSFFKGTFQRRTVLGAEFSWQDLYRIKTGDLVFSNIMAWEQAIAVAQPEDDDCVGNHRMLTCEARAECAVPGFLWYYFTTPDGFDKVYAASPGTAARNRTITASALMAIDVPTPPLATQQAFDRLQAKVAALRAQHTAISAANSKILPATLERIFYG